MIYDILISLAKQTPPILGASINTACVNELKVVIWKYPIEVAVINFESAIWWKTMKKITSASMLAGQDVALTKLAESD